MHACELFSLFQTKVREPHASLTTSVKCKRKLQTAQTAHTMVQISQRGVCMEALL